MIKNFLKSSMGVIAMAGGVLLSSCGQEKEYYNPNASLETVKAKYEADFISKYGAVSPNETWDFSQRGSTLAEALSARVTRGNGNGNGNSNNSNYLTDWRGTESYGYVWNYAEKGRVSDPMPENEVNSIYKNYWTSTIVPAINAAGETDWNPSGQIIFREFATSRNTATASKYFAVGIDDGSDYLYLRMGSPANGNNSQHGTSGDQHTSSLDFSQIPSTATWYVWSTTAQNKNKIPGNNGTVLTKFKEVTVTINNKEYTFWCFKCDVTNGDYTDLVLWVQKVPTVPVLVDCKRYFVEDLGGDSDHDFNDIVFDVALFSDGRQTCYVRALGGTLDITIKVGNGSWTKSSKYDADQMYNTKGAVDYDANLAEFDVTGWDRVDNNVQVVVEGQNGQHYGIPFPETGKIPFIIAVMDGKHWMPEYQPIPSTEWLTQPNE